MLRSPSTFTTLRKRLVVVENGFPSNAFKFFSTSSPNSTTFFNRQREMVYLDKKLFGGKPFDLFVMNGPPNCGKSRLMAQYFASRAGRLSSIQIDLRGLLIEDKASVITIMNKALLDWTHTILNTAPEIAVSIFGKFETNQALLKAVADKLKDVTNPIEAWEDAISRHHNQANGRPLCIFIDESNRLAALKNDKLRQVLEGLLTLLVKVSKQKEQCNVILATTDSFLVDELNVWGLSKAFVKPLTLGFLCHDEAHRYLNEIWGIEDKSVITKLVETYGGDIRNLDGAGKVYKESPPEVDTKIEDDIDFAKRVVQKPMMNTRYSAPYKMVVEALVSDGKGYLEFTRAAELTGEEVLQDIIRNNWMTLRYGSPGFGFDIPQKNDFICPMSPLQYKGMMKLMNK